MRGFLFKRKARGKSPERRSRVEVRENWVRVGRWASVPVNQLKISKYILGKTSLTKNNPYS